LTTRFRRRGPAPPGSSTTTLGGARPLDRNASSSAAYRLAIAAAILGLPNVCAAAVPCDGTIVTSIEIRPVAPSFVNFPAHLRPLVRAAGVFHTTTETSTISHLLLLRVGEHCSERARAESERVLRLQPFLAAATVSAMPDSSGGTRIEIETVDEIPTIVGIAMRGAQPSRLLLGNGNAGGEGILFTAQGERGFAYRSGAAIHVIDYAAFGGPYRLELLTERAPLGGTFDVALGHAFLTDLQRTAWHVGYADLDNYVPIVRPDRADLSLQSQRWLWDAGGVRRLGIGRFSMFVGALITHERVAPAHDLVTIADTGLVADTSRLAQRLVNYSNVRANAVVGVRALQFMQARGFDALAGVQDVATGVQLGALVGRGIPRLGGSDDDVFLSTDLYAGLGSATSFFALRVEGEAREPRRTGHWDSLIGSGRVAWYLKPSPHNLFIVDGEYTGGGRTRVPFQLLLGDPEGGVRGYGLSHVVGAMRAVGRLEERWLVGRPKGRLAVGVASFADAGRVWAGDAPFGMDSKIRVGVGAGLLVAAPAESKRLWRLDLAAPISADRYARRQLRLSVVQSLGFWREPRDIARARAGAAPSTIFAWP
jgi:hypothetical protein